MDLPESLSRTLHGTKALKEELVSLKISLEPLLLPDWFLSLLESNKLGNVTLSLDERNDASGEGADLYWFTPSQIISESLDAEPGKSAIKMNFLPIAGCGFGSGDPYFLDFRSSTDDPPLVRILHDHVIGDGAKLPPESIVVVCDKLSFLFEHAELY